MSEIKILETTNIKNIHFIGIGGISMSGLAEILHNEGYNISGSDITPSNITDKLEKMNMKVYIGHSESNIKDPNLVVYTAAIKESNPELAKARTLNIPVIDRAALLGEIMRRYPYSVAISGTHGKTTTTSMVTMIMLEANMNPTAHIGGELNAIDGNTRIGGKEYFISEACEYVESFLKFYPYLAVILNIELDHLDYFKDIEHIKSAFLKFAQLVPENGFLIGNADDINTMEVLSKINSCTKFTFGISNEEAEWRAGAIRYNSDGCAVFSVKHNGENMGEVVLCVPGIHNLINALAAIAVCGTLGCDFESIKNGLLKFTGTHRRFEMKYIINNVKVIDDYAHHPSEIKATLLAIKRLTANKVWCVFQPHTYTRTKMLLGDFSNAFGDADNVIVTDIYAAREQDTGIIHSKDLTARLKQNGKNAIYIKEFDRIANHLKENMTPGDIIVTMGAGDIYKVGDILNAIK
ncbi:MAG: UDP-N-acetylmuramate--L-alanine ligase [Clostridia bacterium]